jgi:hypothetical protein
MRSSSASAKKNTGTSAGWRQRRSMKLAWIMRGPRADRVQMESSERVKMLEKNNVERVA